MKDENKNPLRVDLLSPSLRCKTILHQKATQVNQRISIIQVCYTPYGTILKFAVICGFRARNFDMFITGLSLSVVQEYIEIRPEMQRQAAEET